MKMRFNETTVAVHVRKDFGKCFDFYAEKIGLAPVFGDRNGPYTSFAAKEGDPPCFAIFVGKEATAYKGYAYPEASAQPDTLVATIPTDDIAGDYRRLKEKGVEFLGEVQRIEEWGGVFALFRDPEGNLFSLSDAGL